MISKSNMRQIMRAARQNWDTPIEQQRQAVADVREVLDSAEVSERTTETALLVWNALEECGWVENVKNAEAVMQ